MLGTYSDKESHSSSASESPDHGCSSSSTLSTGSFAEEHGGLKWHPDGSPLDAARASTHHLSTSPPSIVDSSSFPHVRLDNDSFHAKAGQSWRAACRRSWAKNRGLVLVLVAQLFGALMNVTTRLLETDGEGMHPLQILIARMGITVVLCCGYMWYTSVPDFPFGKPEVRLLLVARGMGGFFGVYGMYYSLLYLPIAEATVITFLAPTVACWACSILIHEPFTRMEQVAGLVSLLGVVLIARPAAFLFGSNTAPIATGDIDGTPVPDTHKSSGANSLDDVTSMQRLGAVGVALLGVAGAACAYTTIRWIGKRAHPLISVNYLATWCSIVSVVGLLVVPGVDFRLPANLRQWGLLLFLGLCGFAMQLLLTTGLQHEKSSRATNMVYTQMLFALTFDKLLWGTTPGALSIVGSSLILSSAIYVAVPKDAAKKATVGQPRCTHDEEQGLVHGVDQGHSDGSVEEEDAAASPSRDSGDVQMRPMRGQ